MPAHHVPTFYNGIEARCACTDLSPSALQRRHTIGALLRMSVLGQGRPAQTGDEEADSESEPHS